MGELIQTLTAIFYAEDGLVASPESDHFQGAFDVLTGLFDQVGLHTNVGNMASTAFRKCYPPPPPTCGQRMHILG